MRWSSTPWAVAAAWGGAVAAVAQPAPEALQACVRITEDSQRLACFDREIAALSRGAGSGTHPAAAGPAAAAAPAAASASPAASAPSGTAPVSPPTAPAANGTAAAGAVPAAAAAAATAAATATTGSPAAQVKPPDQVKLPNGFTAHIASISRNAAGRAVVTLDNGQVWRQSETRASFEASAGDAVTISSGVLGSYWLVTSVHNRTRVERVR